MAIPTTDTIPAPGSGPAAPVASQPAPAAPGGALATAHAAETVPLYGGNRGGKPRKDGLPPGSPEAKEADLKAQRERMANLRLLRKIKAGQRLPSADTPEPSPAASVAAPPSPAAPGVVALPGNGLPNWTADDARPLLTQGVALTEALYVSHQVNKLVEARAPATVIEKLEPDLKFPALSRQTVIDSGPAGLAKLLNELSVPKALKDYLLSVPAIGYIVVHAMQQNANVNKLIASLTEKPKPAEPAAKP